VLIHTYHTHTAHIRHTQHIQHTHSSAQHPAYPPTPYAWQSGRGCGGAGSAVCSSSSSRGTRQGHRCCGANEHQGCYRCCWWGHAANVNSTEAQTAQKHWSITFSSAIQQLHSVSCDSIAEAAACVVYLHARRSTKHKATVYTAVHSSTHIAPGSTQWHIVAHTTAHEQHTAEYAAVRSSTQLHIAAHTAQTQQHMLVYSKRGRCCGCFSCVVDSGNSSGRGSEGRRGQIECCMWCVPCCVVCCTVCSLLVVIFGVLSFSVLSFSVL
jgi:hypothetical protein